MASPSFLMFHSIVLENQMPPLLQTTENNKTCVYLPFLYHRRGPSWSWSYDSWIFNYLCN